MRLEHVEGRQSVLAALTVCERRVQIVLFREGVHAEKVRDVAELAERRGVPTRRVPAGEFDALAHGATHGGVLALCSHKPRWTIERLRERLAPVAQPLLVLLEGIEDARNLGFVLRTAEALGAHALLIKKHVWDFDSTEVARPASGAFERLPIVQFEDAAALGVLKKDGLRVFGCVPTARRTLYERDLAQPVVLALGGEKRGLSAAVRRQCDRFMSIPTVGGASSLSLSHAAAIVLGETFRQRRIAAERPECQTDARPQG